jgi:hypothetical protein
MTLKAFDPNQISTQKFKPLNDTVIVSDMAFDQRITSSGIILLNDNGKGTGIRPRWGRVDFIGTSVIIHRFGDFPRFRRNARCGCRKSDSRLVLCSADESRRPWPQDRKQALLRVLQQARQGFVLDDSMGDGRREEVTAVHAMHQGWYHGRSINAWPNRSLRECDPPAFAQDTNARSERLIASGRATGSRATTSCCGGDCGRPSCCTNRRRTASGRATTSRRGTASI